MTCKLKSFCKQGETCVAHDGYDIWRCTAFKDKGVPMTNEEYLKSCNTEQLANVFFDYRYINATPQQQLWLSANEDFVKGGIVEWLKQQHT